MCTNNIGCCCVQSEVFVVRGSLDVLDVGFWLDIDTAVDELLVGDGVTAILHLARALPVPVEASDVLEARHLFIRQVSDDLDHVATIAVNTEHLMVEQLVFKPDFLESEGSNNKTANDPLSGHGITKQYAFHYFNNYNTLLDHCLA
jgi:beta-xylosidase